LNRKNHCCPGKFRVGYYSDKRNIAPFSPKSNGAFRGVKFFQLFASGSVQITEKNGKSGWRRV
jgi:hypothetical protein